MFVTKFVILILHVYFNVDSGICCTKVFICGRLFTHWNWKNLFIHVIQYWPQFVKLVIIRALRIGLFVLLKWNFLKHIFQTVSFPTYTYMPKISFQALETGVNGQIIQIQRNFWVPYAVQFIGLFGFIWLLYKFVSSVNFGNQFFCKKKYWKKRMA
jgi:hypothetical protein